MARATSIKRKRSRCPERLSSCSEAAGVARSSGPLPGCPRKAKNPSAPCCSSYSAAPRQWHLGSARASPPDPSLSTTSRDGRDASDRLLQPTFQRRAPLLRVAAGEPRSKLRDTDGVCAQRRSTRFDRLIPSRRRAFSAAPDAFKGRPLTSRRRPDSPCALSRTRRPSRRPEIDSAGAPLRATAFPIQDAFHRQGALASSADPALGHSAVQRSAPIRPWRKLRSGLGHLPALSRDRERLGDPTPLADFCNQFTERGHAERDDHFLHGARHFGALRCSGVMSAGAAGGTASELSPCRRPRAPAAPADRWGAGMRAAAQEADSLPAEHLESPATPPKVWCCRLARRRSRPASDPPRER